MHAQTIIRFKTHISTDAKYLSDLLIIKPDEMHLGTLALEDNLRAGQKITKSQLIQWINNKKKLHNYQWKGKQKSIVENKIITSGIALTEKAQTALKFQLEQQSYDAIELSNTANVPGSSLPLADFSTSIKNDYPVAKKVCVQLHADNATRFIWFKAKAFKKVLVAQHNLKSGSVLNKPDFKLVHSNIAGLDSSPLTTLPQQVWLIKSLHRGQVLTKNYLAPKPTIIQGQQVQIHVLTQGVKIITEGEAQKEGNTGQVIPIKTPTNKSFNARIIGPNQVEVL